MIKEKIQQQKTKNKWMVDIYWKVFIQKCCNDDYVPVNLIPALSYVNLWAHHEDLAGKVFHAGRSDFKPPLLKAPL